MAVTKGHGNPDWSRDETLLALDLYFRCGRVVPGGPNEEVNKLSAVLRTLPIHPLETRQPSFRNPDGVSFKLQNLHNVATGKGLGNVSQTDRETWAGFGSDPLKVSVLAAAILAGAPAILNKDIETDPLDCFPEGEVMTALHKKRERSPKLRKKLLNQRRATGALACDACLRLGPEDQRFTDSVFEAHHLVPLASIGKTETRLKDLALLCASCHRLMHRAMSLKHESIGIGDLKLLLSSNT